MAVNSSSIQVTPVYSSKASLSLHLRRSQHPQFYLLSACLKRKWNKSVSDSLKLPLTVFWASAGCCFLVKEAVQTDTLPPLKESGCGAHRGPTPHQPTPQPRSQGAFFLLCRLLSRRNIQDKWSALGRITCLLYETLVGHAPLTLKVWLQLL